MTMTIKMKKKIEKDLGIQRFDFEKYIDLYNDLLERNKLQEKGYIRFSLETYKVLFNKSNLIRCKYCSFIQNK